MLNVIITGTSGMVGKGVLLECLESAEVEKVLIVNRTSIGLTHPKLKEVLVPDFFDLTDIEQELSGYNACYFCLGISAAGMSEKSYRKVTYDLTLLFANTILKQNTNVTFCYVSGAGTDTSERSAMMWARVKGKTENSLLALPFKNAYMFRPGLIRPLKGARAKAAGVNLFYSVITPFYPIFNLFPKAFTDTVNVGKAMIKVSLNGFEKQHLTTGDINAVVQS